MCFRIDPNQAGLSVPNAHVHPTGGGTYEFSITLQPNAELDKDHVVFGRLETADPAARTENEAVVQKILAVRGGPAVWSV